MDNIKVKYNELVEEYNKIKDKYNNKLENNNQLNKLEN